MVSPPPYSSPPPSTSCLSSALLLNGRERPACPTLLVIPNGSHDLSAVKLNRIKTNGDLDSDLDQTEQVDEIWERQLYRRQKFPDNHIDQTFLDVLREASSSPPRPKLGPLILSSLVIFIPLSIHFLFIAVFHGLLTGRIDPGYVILGSLGAGSGGWLIWWLRNSCQGRFPLRPSIISLLLLHALAPILRTLTEATTSDSIWPLAGGLFVLGLLLGDHGRDVGGPKRLSSSLALTSSLSASVVLASRLPTNTHVFALVLYSILSFALGPILLRQISPTFTPPLATALFGLTIKSLLPEMPTTSATFMFLTAGIILAGPLGIRRSWRLKSVIKGDWDVALPVVRQSSDG
ncbi:N-acetylglucosaminyltransferase complex, subunit PIG-C/GPI2, required for phosphatidylinositol biosynthesis [Phaffia rhodozyma]|uniref:N-acetylglucosaminyltransferase complex, subunit PIG-C/GPI2, required for phosphatidylinositol biosynthesis n=1 Tax=Phaffia rhodozyma TaxID=264483 RepID=A0A0F7SHB7_PHARH|nr:N-acetylglucosaminyltransferase complex, subunit PIG-C/GPI2, required for phosphatidylinositol biosynthesis [Phaffia rhodozyma]